MKKDIAVKYFGTITNLARALSISKSWVSEWGEVVPEKQALKLHFLTKGDLKYKPEIYEKHLRQTQTNSNN